MQTLKDRAEKLKKGMKDESKFGLPVGFHRDLATSIIEITAELSKIHVLLAKSHKRHNRKDQDNAQKNPNKQKNPNGSPPHPDPAGGPGDAGSDTNLRRAIQTGKDGDSRILPETPAQK